MEMLILFGLLILFLAMGIPVAVSIGIAALGTILVADLSVPLSLVPRQIFGGMNSYALMAVPFFVLAGEMMNAAGVTQRIIRLALAVVGHIRGSLAQVNVLGSLMMSGVSGSGAADTAALGTVLIPEMAKKGYSRSYAVAVTAASATIGPIIPPSVLFVVYGSLTNVSVGALFLGGVLPGILMGALLMVVAYYTSRRRGYQQKVAKFSWSELGAAALGGLVAAVVPTIIVGAIFFGIATATEVGVIAVVVSMLLGVVAFGRLRGMRELTGVLTRALTTSAAILLIIGTSGLFANVLTRLQFQGMLLDTFLSISTNPTVILIMIVVSLLVLGLFIDVTPLLIMFAAPLAAVASEIGYDPIFFGVLVVITATIGAVTPPVGGYLIIASGIARIPLTQTVRPLLPFWLSLVASLGILIAFPQLVTFIPSVL
ncbi:TRAP transporter large permease [Nesterenkonia ebinurensis]|uniref:TRAP transporter large permease n=1 Tax=Nesterenkonia ebinurensis TaxID=2608252 RepID=UPI00123D58B8|nr:TRAP transporter large permease [Nesterenkonia ebinurensis]